MPSSKRKYQRKSKRAKKKSRRNDGTLDEYNKLIEKFKIKDKDNRTLLMKLVHHDNIDYVRKYMKDEIESKLSPSEQIEYVNRKDEFGYTALSLASINGNLKLIRYLLLEKKAFKDPKYLIYVINANKLETTKKIINDETTTNQHSLTMALFYCVQNDFDNEIIECLLDNIEFKSELIVYLEEALSDIEKKKSKENEKEVKLITGVILEIRKYLEKYS
jgi:ankyrin repeat protein